ncbi:MAG: signal peptidase I [Rickettsiales bacterium]|jgi:signal peptidase I|nr:signal peptidase I [Rickettsiales bacterium]
MKAMVIEKKKKRGWLSEWVHTIFWAGLIAIAFRSILLEPFNIPSGSMIPTLAVGDHLFITKWSYGYSRFSFPFGSWNIFGGRFFQFGQPKRGDIIVFRKPDDTIEYVKRLIGMPGETIQMKAGRLFINGVMVMRENPRRYIIANISEEYKDSYQFADLVIRRGAVYKDNAPVDFDWTIEYKDRGLCRRAPSECIVEEGIEYDEILPDGRVHKIVEISDMDLLDNTPPFLVPDGHYFMMGDDRDRSADSRVDMLGPIPRDNLLGRVWTIFYSHNYYSPLLWVWDWVWKMRWDRFGLSPR